MPSDRALQLDELDRRLVHLLQIAPRASWADAARVLHSSPATVSARWSRLERAGAAWLSVYPNPVVSGWLTAFVQLDVRGVRVPRSELIERLCAMPSIVGLSETDRLSGIAATVFASDQASLERFLLDDLPEQAPGIDAIARVAVRLHAEGAHWRLDALSAAESGEAAALGAGGPFEPGSGKPGDDALIAALIEAPRAPIATIARDVDRHPATVLRRVRRLLAEGRISMRCDLSPRLAGWPVERTWLLEAPGVGADVVAARLRGMRELRLAASLASDVQIAVTALSRSLEDSVALEARVSAAFPEGRVVGRIHHLRTRKRMGRVLDASGRPEAVDVPDRAHTGRQDRVPHDSDR